MWRIARATALAAGVALSSPLAGPREGAVPPISVGEFARALVEALQGGGAPASGRVNAVRGVVAGKEKALLTEGLAVTLLGAAGVRASTFRPDREVSEERALAFIRSAMAQAATSTTGASASPAQGPIDSCLALSNHGECVVCCKDQAIPANTCAKACFVINKPSPSEPLP